MRRFLFACAVACVVLFLGYAGVTIASAAVCKPARAGRGYPGACAPPLASIGPHPTAPAGVQFQDRSNNNPTTNPAALKAGGARGLVVKLVQGSYVDQTAASMAAAARGAGLAVGGYDFDQNYSLAEAQLFAARARAIGMCPGCHNQLPLYLDVEYGAFSLTGLKLQVAYLQSQGWRVGVYTGAWYWTPHAGNVWLPGLTAWLSGYPDAPLPIGLPVGLYEAHQYTDSPVDMSVFVGSSWSKFVNARKPKPKTNPEHYDRYPAQRFAIDGDHLSERANVRFWDKRRCVTPVRRRVCVLTRGFLQLLRSRLLGLHKHGHKWSYGKPASIGARNQQVWHRLLAKHPILTWKEGA